VLVASDLGVKTVRAGGVHTCADSLNQVLHCWGSNASGQLARNGGNRTTPTQTLSNLPVKALSVGDSHTCIITQQIVPHLAEGTAFCVGLNDRGQLGDGGTTSRDQLQKVGGSAPLFLAISAGQNHTCAIAVGTRIAWCWGDNKFGQLGNGATSTTPQAIPEAVTGQVRFLSITAGTGHTCGISTEGLGYCWGLNDIGQLGDGTVGVNRTKPTVVQSP
jgi:alpha-tubulin suppressor-like RCC1 family protein